MDHYCTSTLCAYTVSFYFWTMGMRWDPPEIFFRNCENSEMKKKKKKNFSVISIFEDKCNLWLVGSNDVSNWRRGIRRLSKCRIRGERTSDEESTTETFVTCRGFDFKAYWWIISILSITDRNQTFPGEQKCITAL